jgi:hypothetical protein
MMRLLAATFLLSAAVNWPTVWLDRAGVALVGFACLALALPRVPRSRPAPTPFAGGPFGAPAADDLDELMPEHVERVRRYLAGVGSST